MGGLVAAALALGGLVPSAEAPSGLSEPAHQLPAAAAVDRRRLTDAIKAASRCGETGRPTVADFDVATVGWGRQAAHLYILPLDLEDALRRHDAAHPDARLGGPPLDFHAADRNLVLCVGGVHDMIQEALCEYLTDLIGRKVGPGNVGRAVVDHLSRLPAKDRAEFVAKLVAAQRCLRSAARETALGLVSDETDCAKVIKRVGELGAEPEGAAARVAKANKEFQTAFAKWVKAAAPPAKK
jgi:hypothetical protein